MPVGAQVVTDPLFVTISNAGKDRAVAKVTVRNPGPAATQVTISLGDWERAENGDNKFLPANSTRNSCGALLSVFPLSLRLEPRGAETISIRYEGSRTLRKECWNAVIVEQAPQRATSKGSSLQYVMRSAVKVYVVPPGMTKEGAIEDVQVVATPVRPGSPARTVSDVRGASKHSLAITFHNLGGMHLFTRGRIEIRRLDNTVAAELPVAEFPTLPGAVRKLLVGMPVLPKGIYVALVLLDFGGAEIAAGELEIEV